MMTTSSFQLHKMYKEKLITHFRMKKKKFEKIDFFSFKIASRHCKDASLYSFMIQLKISSSLSLITINHDDTWFDQQIAFVALFDLNFFPHFQAPKRRSSYPDFAIFHTKSPPLLMIQTIKN